MKHVAEWSHILIYVCICMGLTAMWVCDFQQISNGGIAWYDKIECKSTKMN